METRIQLNTRVLPVLTALLFVMQLIDPSRVWMVLLIGLGGTWLVSYFWARSLAQYVRLRREMRFGWAQVGDRLEERFTLDNQGWAPAVWVEIIDHSTLPDQRANRVTGVGSNSQTQWYTHGLCSRRGLFTLGPTSLHTGDPFGIYTVKLHDPATRSLMVMPPIVPLPSIEVAPGGRSGEGRPRPDAPERTVSSGSVREYLPGDSMRWIHWRTTARRQKPFVRIFDGTPAGDWRIILDMDKNVQVGEGWDSTEEFGVILAASLADFGLRLRRAVGLIANSNETVWLPPAEGENQRWEILRALALVDRSDRSLVDLLRRVEPSISSHTSIVLITPSIEGDWLEALLPLMWRGITPTVLLLDPISFGGTGNTSQILAALARLGVRRYVISRDLLDRPEARPGQEGRWEWRISPRGRAILVRKPGDLSWKVLS